MNSFRISVECLQMLNNNKKKCDVGKNLPKQESKDKK